MSLAVRTILPLVPRGAAGCAYASPRGPAARDPGTWTEPSSRSGKGSLIGELVDPLYVPSNDPCPVSSNGKAVSEKRYPPPSWTIAPSNETVGALGASSLSAPCATLLWPTGALPRPLRLPLRSYENG